MLLRFERMSGGVEGFAEEQRIIARHQFVRDAHQLAEHFRSRLGEPDVIPKALAHFHRAIEPFENGQNENDLLRLAFVLLKIAADETVEKLIRPSELNVRFYHDGIPSLHDRILNLVSMDGVAFVDAVPKIFALEHLLQSHHAVEPDHVVESHL